MPERNALILDDDRDFSALVERSLLPRGFKVDVASDTDGGLKRIARLRPEIVFVAVDLPERTGFTVCTKTKRLVKGIRVVLATSTIPWREMEMHQKLKVHADLYLDKRRLDETEFRRQVGALFPGLPGTPEAPLSAPAERVPPRASADPVTESPLSSSSATGSSIQSDLDVEAFLTEVQSPPSTGESASASGEGASREQESFLALHDRLTEGENEIARLRLEVVERDRTIASLQQRLREVVTPMAASLREKAAVEQELKEVRERLDSARAEAQVNQAAALRVAESEHLAAVVALQRRLDREKSLEIEVVRLEEEKKLAAALAGSAEALANLRRTLDKEHQAERAGDAQELARMEAAYSDELALLRTRRQEHADEAQRLFEVRLAEAKELHAESGRRAEETHQRALDTLERRREAEKVQALEASKAEYEHKLNALLLMHREALAEAKSEQQAALRCAAEERDAQKTAFQQQEQELRRKYDARLAEMQAAQDEARQQATENQLAATKAIEEGQVEKERAAAAAKAEAEKAVGEVTSLHQQLETLRETLAQVSEELAAQKAAMVATEARLKSEAEEALRVSDNAYLVTQQRAADELRAVKMGFDRSRSKLEAKLAEAQAEVRRRAENEQTLTTFLHTLEEALAKRDSETRAASERATDAPAARKKAK